MTLWVTSPQPKPCKKPTKTKAKKDKQKHTHRDHRKKQEERMSTGRSTRNELKWHKSHRKLVTGFRKHFPKRLFWTHAPKNREFSKKFRAFLKMDIGLPFCKSRFYSGRQVCITFWGFLVRLSWTQLSLKRSARNPREAPTSRPRREILILTGVAALRVKPINRSWQNTQFPKRVFERVLRKQHFSTNRPLFSKEQKGAPLSELWI